MTNVGRVCMEPTKKNKLVDIHYSVRSVPNLNIDSYISEGDNLLILSPILALGSFIFKDLISI